MGDNGELVEALLRSKRCLEMREFRLPGTRDSVHENTRSIGRRAFTNGAAGFAKA